MTTTPAHGAHTVHSLSIVDFLTDGSLPRALEEVSRLTGARLSLHDPSGRRVISADADVPWALVDDPAPDGAIRAPLLVDAVEIGSICAPPGHDVDPLSRIVHLIAQTTSDFCSQQLELEHRVKELTSLFRLTGLLARAADIDNVLAIALDSALDVLELDAGSVVLFEPDADGIAASDREEDLVLKAARNLSPGWLASPIPLSRDRLFDRLALKGQIVVSEDLQADHRIQERERVAAEGLGACIHAGLVIAGRPIGVIRLYAREPRSFDDASQRLLRSIAQQAALAVEQARLLEIKQHERQVQRQLDMAASIQRRMMPRAIPSRPGVQIVARSKPSLELGGDFYDVFEMGDRVALAIGDAVGKGIPAALLIAGVRATLRAGADDEPPAELLARVNRAMARDAQPGEFATVLCAALDATTRRLEIATAGHDPPLLARIDESGEIRVTDIPVSGLVVGIDPAERYTPTNVDLLPGDVVVAYTDGVPDTLDFQQHRFTKVKLRAAVADILARRPTADAITILEHIFWSLRQHAGLAVRADDQTVIVLRIERD
jgi:sigma-B regulation protein RsbU (phosphoserine phosphatase)